MEAGASTKKTDQENMLVINGSRTETNGTGLMAPVSWSMTPGTSTKVLGITSAPTVHGKRLADDQWQVVLSGSGRPHGNGSGGTYS